MHPNFYVLNPDYISNQVHGLVALLHGQASTENALKASEQARYLLIFTLLTVVFVSDI